MGDAALRRSCDEINQLELKDRPTDSSSRQGEMANYTYYTNRARNIKQMAISSSNWGLFAAVRFRFQSAHRAHSLALPLARPLGRTQRQKLL